MSHTKYTTPAWVVGKLPSGEASARVVLYTQAFGLLYAFAKSARENRSRLRYSLEPGMRIDASLIRGRYEWRLASARELMHPTPQSEEGRLMRARTLRLLRRMVKGEEANEGLFLALDEAFRVVEEDRSLEEWSGLEVLSILRILARLGYLGGAHLPKEILPYLEKEGYDPQTLLLVHEKRLPLVSAINEALKASHL